MSAAERLGDCGETTTCGGSGDQVATASKALAHSIAFGARAGARLYTSAGSSLLGGWVVRRAT